MNWLPEDLGSVCKDEEGKKLCCIIYEKDEIGKILGKEGKTVQAIETLCGTRVQIEQQRFPPASVYVLGEQLGAQCTFWFINDIIRGRFKGFAFMRQFREFVIQIITNPTCENCKIVPPQAIYVKENGYIALDQLHRYNNEHKCHPPEALKALRLYSQFCLNKPQYPPTITFQPPPIRLIPCATSNGLPNLTGISQSASSHLPTSLFTSCAATENVSDTHNAQNDNVDLLQALQSMVSSGNSNSGSSAYLTNPCMLGENMSAQQYVNDIRGEQTSSASMYPQSIVTSQQCSNRMTEEDIQNMICRLSLNRKEHGPILSEQQYAPNSCQLGLTLASTHTLTPTLTPTSAPYLGTTLDSARGNAMNQRNTFRGMRDNFQLKIGSLSVLNKQSSEEKNRYSTYFI